MSNINIRDQILESITRFTSKENKIDIPIIKKELKFEASKYSSTKDQIYHIIINDIKLKKNSDYLVSYKCLLCGLENTVSTTQFLRKIRNCKKGCYSCCNISSYIKPIVTKQPVVIKQPIITKKTFIEKHDDSINLFHTFPDQYKNSYLLSHLTEEDYNRISRNLISLCNGKLTDFNSYEFWSIYKVNNQMNFSSVMYDKVNNIIFRVDQPILRCDNCGNNWRCKSLNIFKNAYKILCSTCKLSNKTFKIRNTKNINGDIIIYQSKLELKFIEWCKNNNIVLHNGPNIEYSINEKIHKYRVDFMINNILIEIKDFHIWHKIQVENGVWQKKEDAANKYIKDNGLHTYMFITPKNWDEKCKEIIKLIK
jgi:hypothetical protein